MTVSSSNQTLCLPAPGVIRQDTNIVVHTVVPTILLRLDRTMPWLVDVGIPNAFIHGHIESAKLCDRWNGVHLCAYDAFDGLEERCSS